MLRLLLTVLCGLGIAATLLVLRQQRIELQHECNAIHDQMLRVQADLWSQQVQIAAATAPAALETALSSEILRRPEDAPPSPWDQILPVDAANAANAAIAAGSSPSREGDADWTILD